MKEINLATLREILTTLRATFEKEVDGCKNDNEAMAAYDRALGQTLLPLVENGAEQKPRRAYTRHPKKDKESENKLQFP